MKPRASMAWCSRCARSTLRSSNCPNSADQVARLARGWSQQRLADELGTVQSAVHRIENGRIQESWDDWDALSMLQGMTEDVFQSLSMRL